MSLTVQQKKVFDFITVFQRLRGITPSYSEIAKGLGLKSKSNIWRLVHELRAKGLVDLDPHISRSLRTTDKTVQEMARL
jgi:SOS-response transcriptional repressor LexA